VTYLDILRAALPVDEGVRSMPYTDSVGKVSIGIGRNLTDCGIRKDEMTLMLENDIAAADEEARELVANFDALSDARKAVLVNMAFNMGERTLAGFTHFLAAVNSGRFSDAADFMLDSLWAREVGTRAKRLSDEMRAG
jgi:GH24 family phage-related lysozyme (muramidase)